MRHGFDSTAKPRAAFGWLGALLCLVALTGCCGTTFTDATTDVIREDVIAWRRVRTYIALTKPAGKIDGKTGDGWLGYSQDALANVLLLQAKAEGRKLTYKEAQAQAEEVDLP